MSIKINKKQTLDLACKLVAVDIDLIREEKTISDMFLEEYNTTLLDLQSLVNEKLDLTVDNVIDDSVYLDEEQMMLLSKLLS